ncbi:MAG: CHRD domain-containing protein [Gammaproteobacteria bacterium]|nr:CHRD domain-containing protein [Gammaproteobacteria bacterium]
MHIIQKIPILILILGLTYGCSDSDNSDSDNNGGDVLDANTISLSSVLDSEQVITQSVSQPVISSATASAEVTIDQESSTVTGQITVSNNTTSSITNVHIHEGFAGTKGGIIISLQQGAANNVWNIPSDVVLTATQLDTLLAGGMYLTVHTQINAGGELRGQIVGDDTEVVLVNLNGDNEVPPVTTSASGIGYVTLDTVSGDMVTNVLVDNVAVEVAHLHQAFAGEIGSPVVPLNLNADKEVVETTSTLTADQLTALLNGEMYFNIHSEANQGGELRGQIAPSGIEVIRANISGDQSVPPVTTEGTGVGYVTVDTESRELVANARIDNIVVNVAHVHNGARGVNGGIEVPLNRTFINDKEVWVANETITENQLAVLLRGEMYFNIHTGDNPEGEIRGQIENPPEGGQEPPANVREPIVGLAPTFASIQAKVFIPICKGCHTASNARNELILDEPGIGPGSTYDLLVGQDSVANSNVVRVDPNVDPNDSYLIQMLKGTALKADGSVNLRMPQGGPFLSQTDIGIISQWIADGAAPPVEVLIPTFDFIQETVFIKFCKSCHQSPNPREGLELGVAATYGQLFEQPSNALNDQILVVPFKPESSYLIKKLELNFPDINGARMPAIDPFVPLSEAVINNIRTWISNGALEVE